MNNTRVIEIRERLLREHGERMRIDGEQVTGWGNINGRTMVMTANRTYLAPRNQSWRSRIIGGWNRLMLKLRRIYG